MMKDKRGILLLNNDSLFLYTETELGMLGPMLSVHKLASSPMISPNIKSRNKNWNKISSGANNGKKVTDFLETLLFYSSQIVYA